MGKAVASGVDAVILDLEDSVPAARKAEARERVAAWVATDESAGVQIWVRVNPGSLEEDIAGSVRAPVFGIVMAKAEQRLVAAADAALVQQERRTGVDVGTYRIFALIETARGLLDAGHLASAERVDRLGIGLADLTAELGMRRDAADQGPVEALMLGVVIASSAGQITAPVAPTSTDFQDLDALHGSTIRARDLGFRARTCIHPAQVSTVNAVFTPGREELEKARGLLDAYEAAVRDGEGVLTDPAGRLVDEAVVRAARDVIARARPAP